MGSPEKPASYDDGLMKHVAGSTRNLADALNTGMKLAKSIESGNGTFGRIGEEIGVDRAFETACSGFEHSLGQARAHMENLADNVESSLKEMQSRDESAAEGISKSGEGM